MRVSIKIVTLTIVRVDWWVPVEVGRIEIAMGLGRFMKIGRKEDGIGAKERKEKRGEKKEDERDMGEIGREREKFTKKRATFNEINTLSVDSGNEHVKC